MKLLESKIFDSINLVLEYFQNKLMKVRESSFLLSNIDFFILASIIATYIISTFAQTGVIGAISFSVPVFVVLKVLLTKGEKLVIKQIIKYINK